jgi:hypothetical protein
VDIVFVAQSDVQLFRNCTMKSKDNMNHASEYVPFCQFFYIYQKYHQPEAVFHKYMVQIVDETRSKCTQRRNTRVWRVEVALISHRKSVPDW